MVGQGVDVVKLPGDGLGQGEGVKAVALPPELAGDLGTDLRASEDPLQGGAGRVVPAPDARAHPLLTEQLDRRQEQVLEQPQLLPVESLDRGLRGEAVVAHVAQELADVGPVLLLDVGVVVLLVGPPARELNLLGWQYR
jgi:hypothetical protein